MKKILKTLAISAICSVSAMNVAVACNGCGNESVDYFNGGKYIVNGSTYTKRVRSTQPETRIVYAKPETRVVYSKPVTKKVIYVKPVERVVEPEIVYVQPQPVVEPKVVYVKEPVVTKPVLVKEKAPTCGSEKNPCWKDLYSKFFVRGGLSTTTGSFSQEVGDTKTRLRAEPELGFHAGIGTRLYQDNILGEKLWYYDFELMLNQASADIQDSKADASLFGAYAQFVWGLYVIDDLSLRLGAGLGVANWEAGYADKTGFSAKSILGFEYDITKYLGVYVEHSYIYLPKYTSDFYSMKTNDTNMFMMGLRVRF